MSVVFVLVFVAIIMAGAFLVAFVWSVKNGQYEDTYTPSVRMLFDDPPLKKDEDTGNGEKKTEKIKAEKTNRSDQSGHKVKPANPERRKTNAANN